jgi:hypothetical protein
MRARNLSALIAILYCTACGSISGNNQTKLATGNKQTKSVTGTVRFFGFEGGFYGLRGDDSVTYDPTNLPKDFQVDGLRVQSRLNVRSDLGDTHMVGPIVDIVEIEKIRTT